MTVDKAAFSLTRNERLFGRWPAAYCPPKGGYFAGRLWVTDRRIVFTGSAPLSCFTAVLNGRVDPNALAYALDLDPSDIVYESGHLCVSLPAIRIEQVRGDQWLLTCRVDLTIRNNGSIQRFDLGPMSVSGVTAAIRLASLLENRQI